MLASGVPLPLKSLAEIQAIGATFDTAITFVAVALMGFVALGEFAACAVAAVAVAAVAVAAVAVAAVAVAAGAVELDTVELEDVALSGTVLLFELPATPSLPEVLVIVDALGGTRLLEEALDATSPLAATFMVLAFGVEITVVAVPPSE